MIRKFKFAQNNYYHICNRSNDESAIFIDERDYSRFLFFIFAYQAPLSFYNIGRQSSYFLKYSQFNIPEETVRQIADKRIVELNIFTVMPNHFHLLVQEKTDNSNGISHYLQRIQTGYAKYFNTKYKKHGHLFQGAFRAIPVETDEQLLYLSAYIHRNPRALEAWKDKEEKYPWSSCQDLVKNNRWGELLKPDIILNQFSDNNSYYKFIKTSTAKLKPKKIITKDFLLE
ncbi:MAG: transposase [Candidatus Nealsonbacteria bacterium]|nr:transposase [Candidatus Nealsonbacteria bacterium]